MIKMNHILLSLFTALIIASACDKQTPKSYNYVGALRLADYLDSSLDIDSITDYLYNDPKVKIQVIRIWPVFDRQREYNYITQSNERAETIAAFKNSVEPLKGNWGQFIFPTSVVIDKPTITSNLSLFGEEQGSDISDHFYVPNTTTNYILPSIQQADYSYIYAPLTEKPSSMADYFFNGKTISACIIALRDKPMTDVSSAQLTIFIPVEDYLYFDAFDLGGNFDESKVTRRTRELMGTVTIEFK